MNVLALLAKASGIALLMGALLGSYAWNLSEPRRSWLLARSKWLIVPGYVGLFAWAAVFGFGVLVWGCDPAFGGWTRTPLYEGFLVSEVLSCDETPLQARLKPELAAKRPNLPVEWSQVYRRYDEASGLVPDTLKVWLATPDGNVYQVPKDELQFRPVPPRRGTPWWQPEGASDSW